MPSIGALLISIQAKTDELERGMATVRKELAATRSSIKETGTDLRSFGDQLAGLGKAGLAAAGVTLSLAAIKSGVADLVKTGLELKGLQTTFGLLAGSAEAGRREFSFVTETANRLGVDLKTLAASYRGLTAATRGTTLEGQGSRDILIALTQASRVYGLSSEQAGRALLALQQIISKGKVSQEELRQQLGEAIPGATQIAARAFGVTTAALGDMIEKGLDGVAFSKAFIAQLGKETPIATEIAGQGIAKLANELTLLKGAIANSGLVQFFDTVAKKAAEVLESQRKFGEQRQAITERGARSAVGQAGGDFSTALPARQQELLALTEKITRLEALQQRPRGSLLAIDRNYPERLQTTIDALRTQQTELAAVIKLEELQRRRENQPLPFEETPNAEFERAAKAREEQRKRERLAALPEFSDIVDRATKEQTKEQLEKQEAAIKAVEQAAKDSAAAEKRNAEDTITDIARKQKALEQYLETQKLELEQLTLSPQELRNKLVERVTIQFGEAAGKEAGRIEDIKATQQAYKDVENIIEELTQKDEALTKKLLADRDLLSRETTKIERRDLRELQQITDSYASFLTNSILSATDIAKGGFKDFVDSAIRDLIRLNAQTYLTPFLSKLLQTGVTTAVSLLGSPGGAPASLDAGAVEGGLGAIPGLAEGGSFLPHRFYTVGEEGPELLYSGNSAGRVYPNGGGAGGLVVNGPLMAVYANDAGSFRRSSGEIENRLLATVSRAQRNA